MRSDSPSMRSCRAQILSLLALSCVRHRPAWLQVAAHEAISARQLLVAKAGLQKLQSLVAKSEPPDTAGKEAAVICNLIQVTARSGAEGGPLHEELAQQFALASERAQMLGAEKFCASADGRWPSPIRIRR